MDIKLNDNFWDCECEKDYIHHKSVQTFCTECKTLAEDMPDSREDEVNEHYGDSVWVDTFEHHLIWLTHYGDDDDNIHDCFWFSDDEGNEIETHNIRTLAGIKSEIITYLEGLS